MRMNYGAPYQGSKNRIAKDIIDVLPSGNRFVDLFAGGCAMTHCAMLSGKYNEYLANDLYPNGLHTFQDAINGKYKNENRWVSRDEFFKHKDDDDTYGNYCRLCFSFGNDQRTYMYSPKIEPHKKAWHYIVFFDDFSFAQELYDDELLSEMKESVKGLKDSNERRLNLQQVIKRRKMTIASMLQNLERLERLQNLERLDSTITSTSMSYDQYEHKEGDVVYCDQPYKGTRDYNGKSFDHDRFFQWVREQQYPIYFSEYNAPDDFICIWQKEKMKLMCGGNSNKNGKALEKLFIHEKWVGK